MTDLDTLLAEFDAATNVVTLDDLTAAQREAEQSGKRIGQALRERPHQHIDGAAGGEAHDDTDRFCWIGLRACRAMEQRCDRESCEKKFLHG